MSRDKNVLTRDKLIYIFLTKFIYITIHQIVKKCPIHINDIIYSGRGGLYPFPQKGQTLGSIPVKRVSCSSHVFFAIKKIIEIWLSAYWFHTLMTNMKWEPDEYNFFKARRDKGVRVVEHEKHEFYKALDK